MTQAELIVEAQALSTVTEDQFETALSKFVADLTAFVPPATTAAPKLVSVTVNFSDSTSQTIVEPGV